MNLIHEILQNLSSQEIKRVRAQLKHGVHDFEKVGKLFDLITRFPDESEDFYAHKLYKKEADNSFRVTKARLKRQLEEVLLHDKSLREYEAEYISAYLLTRKKLLQGEILMGRGAIASSKNLLEQVITTARKFFFLEELYEASFLLFRHACNSMNSHELSKEVEALTELNTTRSKVEIAAIWYYQLSGKLASTTLQEYHEFEQAKNLVSELGVIWKETQVPITGFYYFKTLSYYAQITFDFDHAKSASETLLSLVRKEPALLSRQREAAALLQLAEVELRSGRSAAANQYVQETLSLYQPGEINYLITLETAFRVAFYEAEVDQCKELLSQAKEHPAYSGSRLRLGKWKYFEAAYAVQQKKHKEALMLLNEAVPVLADKSGWNIAFRLLEIIALFEAKETDLLEAKVENLKQFAKRNLEDNVLSRARFLVDLMTEWHKVNFAFEPTGQRYISLRKEHPKPWEEIAFHPSAFELIRFDVWLLEKGGVQNILKDYPTKSFNASFTDEYLKENPS